MMTSAPASTFAFRWVRSRCMHSWDGGRTALFQHSVCTSGYPATAMQNQSPCSSRMSLTSSTAWANPPTQGRQFNSPIGGSPRRASMFRMPASRTRLRILRISPIGRWHVRWSMTSRPNCCCTVCPIWSQRLSSLKAERHVRVTNLPCR